MAAHTLDSYLQLDGDEPHTPCEDGLAFELDLASQRRLLIHTQPIYLINTSKLQTPQQQVVRPEGGTLLDTRQSSIFSAPGLGEDALHVLDAALTPACAEKLRMPRIVPREEPDYGALAADELLFELSAPIPLALPAGPAPGLLGPSLDLGRFVQAAHTFHDDATWDSPEQYEFVHALTSKLSRYCGYFVADSKEMEYFDKIRLQEVEYRLSKTYFT
ncbi:AGL308Wp [Eremothecium gossypii ATCC 10895]|uniref:AGL308Wp n=1 Tax=Eremothecium gossypii (strain ATCC 10895 / CBS 109.51 / FGSC 9923 / NRRL Y-1056) TaxID=284811 RepID=Q751K9_EREGS|nr:AGL308Wp [Eremothecium gossypii ATCC 10895]AAS54183.1 AGL308Wp [Eremothecium gossypii ATCC 10895]AEY98509.1 FAGL308Wp [Eremothecium gossypii FDAG1]